jgi:hypothetical protein
VGPVERGFGIGFALIVGVLGGAGAGDLIDGEEISDDEVALGPQEFATSFLGTHEVGGYSG